MGRVAVLQHGSKSSAENAVAEPTTLAQRAIKDRDSRIAADLLQASEHLCFAALADEVAGVVRIPAELKQSITEHFDDLTRRANEHWAEESSNILAGIYQSSRNSATKAFKGRAYYQAIEFAHAAEALAHVNQDGLLKL